MALNGKVTDVLWLDLMTTLQYMILSFVIVNSLCELDERLVGSQIKHLKWECRGVVPVWGKEADLVNILVYI